MTERYLGIDQSKRSTGCVWVDAEGSMVDFLLICPPKELDDLELIKAQCQVLDHYLTHETTAEHALVEGIAFGATGSSLSLLTGLQACMRYMLDVEFGISCGTVPVTMWRSKVLSKDEQRVAKAEGKDGLKKATVDKLPAEVRLRFEQYVEVRKSDIKAAKTGKYTDSLYDLTDAYWIAQHCHKLFASK